MKKVCLIVAFLIVCVNGCEYKQEPSPRYMKKAGFSDREYTAAAKRADNGDPAGYLKLYEIARNDNNTYTTDWSEVAQEKLYLLLYSNTELWIKTFSKVDLEKFKDFVGGIGVSEYPKGISSEEQYVNTIIDKLMKIKGGKKDMELVDHILGLYDRKRQ